jgi:NADH dehydrogenase [ubiquinone] 1 alpha subcomplex assembly factor 7
MNELAEMLARQVRESGPIPIADYMAAATSRYYATREAVGAGGDFVTAPEVSQMFGELIGLWAADLWRHMGRPARFVLAELGPGRGTLLGDALRATRLVPNFLGAVQLHLVETSPRMRRAAAEVLRDPAPVWHDHVEELPSGPLILIGNEFLDALPIRQFIRMKDGWHERRIGLAEDASHFTFVADPAPADIALPVAPPGETVEVSPATLALARHLGERVTAEGGVALFIDYGHVAGASGDTLQALARHRRHEVLSDPGEADLTAHVDFAAVAREAAAAGARIQGPVEQGLFLRRLGIDIRAERLIRSADERQARLVASGYRRLVDPAAMGSLFKAIAIVDPRLPPLPGFVEAT